MKSLKTRLVLSFSVLIFVLAALTFIVTFQETKVVLKGLCQSEALSLASVIAADLNGKDGDTLRMLKPGDETSSDFIALRDKLKRFEEAHPDILYVYTLNKVDNEIHYAVDAEFGDQYNPGGSIGEKFDTNSEALVQGFEQPASEDDYIIDRGGSMMSGYAPIRDSKNEIVGVVDVDVNTSSVTQKQNFLEATIFLIFGIGILIAGLMIFMFFKTPITDANNNESSESNESNESNDITV
ncbi:MAG: HAMP domain-containing protein [Endomicrobiales bacterium]